MKYKKIIEGIFLSRPNRFIARVLIEGREETVHVKNTGRCKELLVEGARVFLSCADNPLRKTAYDLVAVEKACTNGKTRLINIDSQAPNFVAEEYLKKSGLFSENAIIKKEVTHGNSRFDFCIEDNGKIAFLEVKGVTLENNGFVSFPDAPTERGVKHLKELVACVHEGFSAYVLFVVQMNNVKSFSPNDTNHKTFGDCLRLAEKEGVHILAVESVVTENEIYAKDKIDVIL